MVKPKGKNETHLGYALRLFLANQKIAATDPVEKALDTEFWELNIKAASLLEQAETSIFAPLLRRMAEKALREADKIEAQLSNYTTPKDNTQ